MKNKNSLIASALLLISIAFSVFVFSQRNVQAMWNSIYATSFSSGDGSNPYPYVIQNESQFAYFLKEVDSGVTYEGKFIKLNNNLDLSNMTGSASGTFKGVFEGNSKTIKISRTLFNKNEGTFRNANVVFSSTSPILLVDENHGLIQNVLVDSRQSNLNIRFVGINATGATIKSSVLLGNLENNIKGEFTRSNEGVIDNCYGNNLAIVSSGGAYSTSSDSPFAYIQRGTIKNSYYNSDVCNATITGASKRTNTFMLSDSFISELNENVTNGFGWERSSNYGGYPVVGKMYAGIVTVNCSNSMVYDDFCYTRGGSLVSLYKNYNSASIYYTIDGSDPRTSSTRKLYDGSFIINDSFTLKCVLTNGSEYGKVKTVNVILIAGDGTASYPYVLSNTKQLTLLRYKTDAYFKLLNDIEFSDEDYGTEGFYCGGFTQIAEFSGYLNGYNHSIINLKGNSGGFIGINNGTITSLRLIDHELYQGTNSDFGALVDTNRGHIDYCYVSSNKTESDWRGHTTNIYSPIIGGIVGTNYGTIKHSVNDSLVVWDTSYRYSWARVGGIAGYGEGQIKNCANLGDVITINSNTIEYGDEAGIVASNAVVYNCLNLGDIKHIGPIDYEYRRYGISGYNNGYGTSSESIGCVSSFDAKKTDTTYRNYSYLFSPNNTNCYKYGSYSISDYPNLDFNNDWEMHFDGVWPKGCVRIIDGIKTEGKINEVNYTLFNNGDLYLYGSGSTGDYGNSNNESPLRNIDAKNIIVRGDVSEIGQYLFYKNSYIETLSLQTKDVSLGKASFGFCESLKTVDFGDGYIRPGDYVFEDCTSLESVHIPEKFICNEKYSGNGSGYDTFLHCSSLKEAVVDCEFIPPFMFESCNSLQNVTFTDPNVRFYYIEKDSGNTFNSCKGNISLIGSVCSQVYDLYLKPYKYFDCTFTPIENDSTAHIYDADSITWIWNQDNTASAKLVCKNNQNHITIMDAIVDEGEVKVASTFTENGVLMYTATINVGGVEYKNTHDAILPANNLLKCGDDVYAHISKLDDNKYSVEFTGSGAMYDYEYGNAPWSTISSEITNVVIEDGISHIGSNALGDLAINKIVIPSSVSSLGEDVFKNCGELGYVLFTGNMPTLENNSLSTFNTNELTIYYSANSSGYENLSSYGENFVCGGLCADNSHNFSHHDISSPKCEIDGNKEYWLCETCGAYYVDNANQLSCRKEVVIPKINHNYGDGVIMREPTCTSKGIRFYICANCSDVKQEDIEKLGHSFINYVDDNNATCTQDGTLSAMCERNCGEKDTKTKENSALGHNYLTSIISPTCTEVGYILHKCSRCDSDYKTDTTSALGHNYTQKTTQSTCLEEGKTALVCTRCENSYVLSTTPALGHNYDDGQIIVPATDTAEGSIKYKCLRCEDEYTSVIPMLGHDLSETGEIRIQATCEQNGLMVYKCLTCEYEKTEVIDALGHNYVDTEHLATCLDSAYIHHSCSRCTKEYDENISSPLGHDYQVKETIDPTCLNDGYTVYKCSRCPETYNDDQTQALGHIDANHDTLCDRDCTYKFEYRHEIIYSLDGGDNHPDNPNHFIEFSDNIALLNPSKRGFEFEGWYDEGDNKVVEINTLTRNNYNLIAKWKKIEYKITYELNDGMLSETNPQKYYVDSNNIVINNPTKTGYTFLGWFEGDNKVTQIEKGNIGDKNLEARWSINKYQLTIVKGDGVQNITGSGEYEYNELVNITAELLAGYENITITGDFDSDSFNMPDRSITVNIGASLKNYTIKYYKNGGVLLEDNPVSYTIKDNTINLNSPNKTGYTFVGWYDENDVLVQNIPKGSYGNRVLNAKYVANSDTSYKVEHYQMKLDGIGYELAETENLTGTTNSVVTPLVKTYENFKSPNAQQLTINPDGTAVTRYYYSRNSFNITYDLNGGENSLNNPTICFAGNGDITLENPTRENYLFLGWFNSDTKVYEVSDHNTDDIHLEARWLLDINNLVNYKEYRLNLGECIRFEYDIEINEIFSNSAIIHYSIDEIESSYAFNEENGIFVDLSSKQLSSQIKLWVEIDGAQSEKLTTSIEDYCNSFDDNASPSIKQMVSALKEYCKYSSIYFSNKQSEERLENNIASEISRYAYSVSKNGSLSSIKLLSASLTLDSLTNLNWHYSINQNKTVSDYSIIVTCDGEKLTDDRVVVDEQNNKISVKGIKASELLNIYELLIKDKSNDKVIIQIVYSPMSYVNQALEDKTVNNNLYNLSIKLYEYGLTAKNLMNN